MSNSTMDVQPELEELVRQGIYRPHDNLMNSLTEYNRDYKI